MLGGFREEAALSTFICNWISTDELRGIDIAIQLSDITRSQCRQALDT